MTLRKQVTEYLDRFNSLENDLNDYIQRSVKIHPNKNINTYNNFLNALVTLHQKYKKLLPEVLSYIHKGVSQDEVLILEERKILEEIIAGSRKGIEETEILYNSMKSLLPSQKLH